MGDELLKKCTKCKRSLPINEFYKLKRGVASWCRECKSQRHKLWAQTERAKQLKRGSYHKNIGSHKKYRWQYKTRRNELAKCRAKNDISFAIKTRMRSLVYRSLRMSLEKKDGNKWQELTGYSINDLREHLEAKFSDGMSWQKFLMGEIHIDHIIPIAAFNITSYADPDFKRCWALNNLQPLWAEENIKKGAKLNNPFQPMLAIGGINEKDT